MFVVEGLNIALIDVKGKGVFSRIVISDTLHSTHLLFVDDIIILSDVSIEDVEKLMEILELFRKAIKMVINVKKYYLSSMNMDDLEIERYSFLFPYELNIFGEGLKYLVFMLKPNNYKKRTRTD